MRTIEAEFAGAALGDRRLSECLVRTASKLAEHPELSFPRATETPAALRATYRLVNHPSVTPDAIEQPHQEQTALRAANESLVFVVHDTTYFEFPGEAEREGLGYVRSADDQGFGMHASLVIAGDGSRRPLGSIATSTFVRHEKKPKRRRGAETFKDEERESLRWGEHITQAEERLCGCAVVHVADREADAFPLLWKLIHHEWRFVIRARLDRAVVDEDGERAGFSSAVIAAAPWTVELSVPVSRQQATKIPARARAAAPERTARVSVRATTLRLKAPPYMPADMCEPLDVNAVHAMELDPPAGFEPLSWVLLTTEPVGTHEQVLRVLDAYRTRWIIEEYFKVLKTGCAIEKRQLESYDALINALAIFVPIAWQVLTLRSTHRTEPDAPAERVLSPTQIDVLRARLPKLMPPRATVDHALRAVAYLGGHYIKKPPGWIVLCRGMEDLFFLERGWLLARGAHEM